MRCLWLTWANPEPRHNGQFVYSGGLIDALAQAEVELEVVGMARPDRPAQLGERVGNVVWWMAPHRERSRLGSLCSPLPHLADRTRSAEVQDLLCQRLKDGEWDAIVFDGISAGWGLSLVRRYLSGLRKRPRIVYISHNHEESLRSAIARGHPDHLKRLALGLDSLKVARLERGLVETADVVTAITPDDAALYTRQYPASRVEVMTPGYDGERVSKRRITQALPRRAVIVGSFDWIAKRMNLEEFIAVADPMFAEMNAELQVIGSAEASFLERLRKRVHATRFTGTVGTVTSFMEQARVALVPEKHGGGFKLKVLDYVFNRMPILALEGSVAGMPLTQGDSILLYPNHAALARGALRLIDDVDRLNELHDEAYAVCSERFAWRSRGEQLRQMLAAA
jgi:glycosyltransferase involved in cell wall biosynthesis